MTVVFQAWFIIEEILDSSRVSNSRDKRVRNIRKTRRQASVWKVLLRFFSARGFTRDAKVRWSALTKKWCWSCCDSWRKRHDAHTSVTGPGLHVSIKYHNLDHRLLYCLVSVRLLLRPSRSIHFGDVSEANGRETATLRPLDHVTRKALAAWQGALLDILSLGWRLCRCFVELHYGNVLETPSLLPLAITKLRRNLDQNPFPKTVT